jgi:hypothetical protein
MATRHHSISGELTTELLASGEDINVTSIALTNVQKVSKCKVDLFIKKPTTGRFYILKGVELPIGTTLTHDISFSNREGDFGLFIKLTNHGVRFELAGDINPGDGTTTVPGSNGTVFLSEISIGDEIEVSGETRTVTNITADDSLVVNATFSTDLATDTTPTCNPTAQVDVILT